MLDARVLARHRRPPAADARGRHGGDRHRPAHHLSRPLALPDRHRAPGAGRRGRAAEAAGGARARSSPPRACSTPARKRPLPFLPEVIGVVTSPTGAVIRDILHRLADRFPRHVLVWPVPVQGEGAARAGRRRHRRLQRACSPGGAVPRPDLLIVARGGGSLEDLWAFNEEIVVRAAAGSHDPADLRRRPRDRHDADRLRLRPPRADADGGGRDGGAGARRAAGRRHAGWARLGRAMARITERRGCASKASAAACRAQPSSSPSASSRSTTAWSGCSMPAGYFQRRQDQVAHLVRHCASSASRSRPIVCIFATQLISLRPGCGA